MLHRSRVLTYPHTPDDSPHPGRVNGLGASSQAGWHVDPVCVPHYGTVGE